MEEDSLSKQKTQITHNKLGLWSLISLVIGSQIGSGALSNPAIFAKYGLYSMYAWLMASVGAICLALVFSKLCKLFPYTGGPHVYVSQFFNKHITFFTGWLYWMISWISTIVVLIACTSYLTQVFQINNNISICIIGLFIWLTINIINSKSIVLSGHIEIFLTIVKVLFFGTFIMIPLFFFEIVNFAPYIPDSSFSTSISAAMWGFIGLEVATTPAESTINPGKNIPKAVLFGTLLVAIIYTLSNISALGSTPYQQLQNTIAPYNQISQNIFGTSFMTNILAFILCLGSLNAWVLAAGQIALGLAKDKLLPAIFGQIIESKHIHQQTPLFSIWSSALGVSIIWVYCCLFNYISNISLIIDALTPGFIIIYLLCSLTFWQYTQTFVEKIYTAIAILFCLFLLSFMNITSCIILFIILLFGTPIYVYLTKKQKHVKIIKIEQSCSK